MGDTGFATLDLRDIRISDARRGQTAAEVRQDDR